MLTRKKVFIELEERYPQLALLIPELEKLVSDLKFMYQQGGTLLVAGNGGSGSDAEHICGELLKGFCAKRELSSGDQQKFAENFGEDGQKVAAALQGGLRAISLLSHPALTSAFGNDVNPTLVFAQQLWAQGKKGDILLGISTSGNAENIKYAFMAARVKGIKTVLLTGNRHGICESFADQVLAVPEKETFKIQELHLPVYHAICLAIEQEFWEK